jgi:hypothetical protein
MDFEDLKKLVSSDLNLEAAEHCCECGRKLNPSVENNPYGAWSIPVVDDQRFTWCTYCREKTRGFDALLELPAGRSLECLKRWLEQPGKVQRRISLKKGEKLQD